MTDKQKNFIETVSVLARNEYLSREKWILPSICIAQAALESGFNLSAKTLFGIKGKGFVATTSEYYNGNKVTIQGSFKKYPNVSSAIIGYYDFLTNTPRYKNAVNNSNYKDAVDKLIHTTDGKPYATDPYYIGKIINIIEKYNLTQYDSRVSSNTITTTDEQLQRIAKDVIAGKYGVGAERKTKLGSNYKAVQQLVNKMLK